MLSAARGSRDYTICFLEAVDDVIICTLEVPRSSVTNIHFNIASATLKKIPGS